MSTEEKAAKIKELAVKLKDRIKTIHGVDGAMAAVPEVVALVEQGADEIKGSDKEDLAVEIINSLVDIPLVPEAAEGFVIRAAIRSLVSALNKWLGNDWLDKLNLK